MTLINSEVYEKHYRLKNSFSFGKNWNKFLEHFSQSRINEAKKSIEQFIPGREIKGRSFIDIGCGSGLFSLAAFEIGAEKITSCDIDNFSVECVKHLKKTVGNPDNWTVIKGSVLDDKFIHSLGKYDIVYSWGVLHHTGNMYHAFENVVKLCKKGGYLFIAVYNHSKGKSALLLGTSKTWLKIKKIYNSSPAWAKYLMELLYLIWFYAGYLASLKNPFTYINNYQNVRGMDFMTDVRDWLGGYPYEFASIDELINYFGQKGLLTKKITLGTLGCHELLMVKT